METKIMEPQLNPLGLQPEMPFTLNLVLKDLDTIAFALRDRPYKDVAELLVKIDSQFREFQKTLPQP
jgi:hypothetical protein